MRLILLGAPGAGKGTQAEILSKRLGIPTISTGNILREAIRNRTETGLKAKAFMDQGKLVPDEVIIGIVRDRLAEPDCANGYILDGMPRTIPQAEALVNAGIEIDCVISIEIDDAVIEQRMTGRRVCGSCGSSYHVTANPPKIEGICNACGSELVTRPDDVPETVRSRLAVTTRRPSRSRASMKSSASSGLSREISPSRMLLVIFWRHWVYQNDPY